MKFAAYLTVVVLGVLVSSANLRNLSGTKESFNVVFMGDSLTGGWRAAGKNVWAQYFEPLGAGNVGVGGYRTTNILENIENGEYDDLDTPIIVLMIGGNDLQSGTNGEVVAQNIRTIINLLLEAKPGLRFLLLGLLPAGGKPDHVIQEGIITREIISTYDDGGVTVKYLDMLKNFGSELGEIFQELYQADQTHLVEAGYSVWAEAMSPVLLEMMGQ